MKYQQTFRCRQCKTLFPTNAPISMPDSTSMADVLAKLLKVQGRDLTTNHECSPKMAGIADWAGVAIVSESEGRAR